MKTLFLLASAALLSSFSFGQENFQDGFVVTAQGDTIKGRINNLLWRDSPKFITFVGPKGQVQYEPEDLQGFSAGSYTIYRSFKVLIDTTGGTGGDRARGPGPTFFESHVFLKVILDSHYSLLKLRQGFRTHFFIHDKGRIPEELISHSSERAIAGQILVQPGNQFVVQLENQMSDCPRVEIKADMKYLEKSFVDLFTKYNECKGSRVLLPGDESKHVYIGGVAAAHYDQFTYRYAGGFGYTAGVFVEIAFPRNIYRTSWYNELAYYRYGNQESALIRNLYTSGQSERYSFEFGTVKLTSLVKSQFLPSRTRPYLLAGLAKVFRAQNVKFSVNGVDQPGYMQGSLDVVLGLGMYATKGLSIELRAYRTILMTMADAGLYDGTGGLHCNSIGLSAAYHIALKE